MTSCGEYGKVLSTEGQVILYGFISSAFASICYTYFNIHLFISKFESLNEPFVYKWIYIHLGDPLYIIQLFFTVCWNTRLEVDKIRPLPLTKQINCTIYTP